MSRVNIYKCVDYEENNISSVINSIIGDFSCLKNVKKGTKIVIKANLVSAMAPDKAATTHPILLKKLTDYLVSKGCKVTIGDSPGGVYTKTYLNHVYNVTKMEETGAELNNNFSTKKTIFNEAKILKTFEYTAYLDAADMIINFCKLKSHGMMGMSCAVKNMFGVIPGTMKPEYHYRFPNHVDFANMLVDLNEYFKPQINIVDAIIGMEGNGPTMGDARHIGAVLASENPYALDSVCAQLIGLCLNDVETIKQSYERKLFDPDLIELNTNLNSFIIKDFKVNKLPNSIQFMAGKKSIISRVIAKFINKTFTSKPVVKKSKCIGCKKCANICPAKAINMVNNKPEINRSKCIKCYCCQEFCPIGAMVVKTSAVGKILKIKGKLKK